MIISNQIKCTKCGDSIYSKDRHDYVSCTCGSVSTDGGQDYLKRCGSEYIDQSIVWDDNLVTQMVNDLKELDKEYPRSDYGKVCCIARTLRDNGYKITKETEEGTKMMIEIYGIPNCKWCVKALDLLSSLDIPYVYYDITERPAAMAYMDVKNNKGSYPYVLEDATGTPIGGYGDLENYVYEKESEEDA